MPDGGGVNPLRFALPSGVVARQAEPLARHTALRTGGPCAWFLVVHRVDALGETLAALKAHELSWSVLGAGTRKVYRDGQQRGAVIRVGTELSRIEHEGGEVWTVGAGVPCAALAWAAARAGRTGMEALARVPGSFGAALALDEGAWREAIAEVAVLSRGSLKWSDPARARKAKLVLGARLELRREAVDRVQQRTLAMLSGATALPSWYLPPKKGRAEDELRRVKADGVRLRGVLIPKSAPEMVVNVGRGPASDLKLLHNSALQRVKQLRGVELTSAVSWVGRNR